VSLRPVVIHRRIRTPMLSREHPCLCLHSIATSCTASRDVLRGEVLAEFAAARRVR
jgi:hypothetical protein